MTSTADLQNSWRSGAGARGLAPRGWRSGAGTRGAGARGLALRVKVRRVPERRRERAELKELGSGRQG